MINMITTLTSTIIGTHAVLSGQINDTSVDKLISMRPTPNTIIITSFGGDERAALKLGYFIFEKDISIVVKNYCQSACAHYILPASSDIHIEQNALVSFHSNMPGIYKTIEIAGPKFTASMDLELFNKKFIEFYDLIKVDKEISLDAIKTLGMLCIDTADQIVGFGDSFYYRASLWVPTREYMMQVGINFSGYWPENAEEVRDLVHEKSGGKSRWVYGPSKKEIRNYKYTRELQRCPVQ